VCLYPEEAESDAWERQAIEGVLREKPQEGPKALVGNRGYRRYMKIAKSSLTIDEAEA
jgi:hypothetical protein